LNKIIPLVDLKAVEARGNHGFHIGIDKFLGNHELLPENVQLAITSNKTYEHDTTARDRDKGGNLGVRSQHQGREVVLLEHLIGCLPLETTVAVVPVVKTLKMFCLLLQCCIAREPLPSEELPAIRIVEVLYHPISPGLTNGNKDRCDTVVQTDAQHNAQGAGIAVASPETQFVIDLEKLRDAHRFPASHEACCHVIIFLGPLGLDMHPVAENINNVEGVKSSISFDVSGPDQIGLMDMVDSCCFSKIGIFDTFRNIGCFF